MEVDVLVVGKSDSKGRLEVGSQREVISRVDDNGLFVGDAGWVPFAGVFEGVQKIIDQATGKIVYDNPVLARVYDNSSVPLSDEQMAQARTGGHFYSL